jgi:hypothetical protein
MKRKKGKRIIGKKCLVCWKYFPDENHSYLDRIEGDQNGQTNRYQVLRILKI